MCGIFVAFNPSGIEEREVAKIRHCVQTAAHRGPDNEGVYQGDNCILGHNRLAIIDLDEKSNQPFVYNDFVIVYNGEVFNYDDIRVELESLGHCFRTLSDTEVVVAAFSQWGVECFARFNGMWALAIYDISKKEIIISRDRFGQKPLFFAKARNTTYFASEFQQLATLVDKDIDFGLIQLFLKEGTYDGNGRTFLRGIQEFPKAHYLRISNVGKWDSQTYWGYWSGEIRKTTDNSINEFSDLLSDAVRLRLRSDVPFGLLVSGGVDSTLIASYARQHIGKGRSIPAFTYSSNDAYDEHAFAKVVSDRLELDLHVSYQEQNPSAYKARLAVLVRHLGRGHSSPAIVSIDYLYESLSKMGVRVALDGQGADELLAGYKNYFALVIPWYLLCGQFRQAWLTFIDQLRFGFITSILLFLRNRLPPSFRKIMRLVYGYEFLFRKYHEKNIPRWISVKPVAKNSNPLNRYLIWHHNLGLENLLYYGDIIAMRNSVENRSPFMDHRLVEFAFSHDDKLKLMDAIDKYVLRKSEVYKKFRDILERDKVGFSSDILPETKRSIIADLRESQILEWPIFSRQMRKFINSEAPMKYKFERFLFRLYQVHLWNCIFISENISENLE